MSPSSTVAVCLWFDGTAEAAARLYTSLIPRSEITSSSPMMVTSEPVNDFETRVFEV